MKNKLQKTLLTICSILLLVSLSFSIYLLVNNKKLVNKENKLTKEIEVLNNDILSNEEKDKVLNEDYEKLKEELKDKIERLESWKKLKETLGKSLQ